MNDAYMTAFIALDLKAREWISTNQFKSNMEEMFDSERMAAREAQMVGLNSDDDLAYLLETVKEIHKTVQKCVPIEGVGARKAVTNFLNKVNDSVLKLVKSALIDVQLRQYRQSLVAAGLFAVALELELDNDKTLTAEQVDSVA